MNEILPTPQPLGLRKSFGFGDRLGLATSGHLAAIRQFPDFAPILAQQSIREMTRTQRTPAEVMRAAQEGVVEGAFKTSWGADGDHLKTPEDVKRVAEAGFCFFTIDPSAFVNNAADRLTLVDLDGEISAMEHEGVFPDPGWREFYLSQDFDVGEGAPIEFTRENLSRAAVKYGRAIAHTALMGKAIQESKRARGFEIEVSVDETDTPTQPHEHLFFGMELMRRNVPRVVSLAPRFVGDFEKGVDYVGDLRAFSGQLRLHVAVAKFCGPYKISIHSGSDKFSVYPIIGRACGDLLHVKTAGTSYLEALRVVARTEPKLFSEIAEYARGRFEADRASYHISATLSQVSALPIYQSRGQESVYLDQLVGRQLLHVTFGSVLTSGKSSRGLTFKEAILGVLHRETALHRELLEIHFVKHLSLLNAG